MVPKNLKEFIEGGKKTRFEKGQRPWNIGTAKRYVCQTCEAEFENLSHGKPKYCSSDCVKNGEWRILNKAVNIGRRHSEEIKKVASERAKMSNTWKVLFRPEVRRRAIENSVKINQSRPSPLRGREALWAKGENNVNWKGGISRKNRTERQWLMMQKEYRNWRREIFERDDYTCQICGERGIYLHADHIKPWATYPGLRYKVDNGRTICKECHWKTETWGFKALDYQEGGGREVLQA